MIKMLYDKYQFRIELFLALVITGLACCAGFSNLLFASNDLYPMTADAMGHMAKVHFLAESFARGEFPTWFPYWYNGSTVAQYYPPLSYWLMAPIYMLTQNAMLTFKINCYIMLFIGGIGVWFFCRSFIGRWCGLFGAVAFCLQPYILLSLFGAGLIAQGPIIALTPWYLIVLLSYSKRPTALIFLLCALLCSLMILSHPMTIFMVCLCIMIVLLVFVSLKKISFKSYFLIGLSIIFAGILTAFWSLVGVTGLENPGIPYLLGEAVMQYTANASWFLTSSSGFFFYAIPISLSSIAALLLFAYSAFKRRASENERYYILFCIILTVVSMIFSFGLHLPLFKYLPMAESFVPGRILSLTSVSAAILCAYLLDGIQSLTRNMGKVAKTCASLVCLAVMILILVNMNPFRAEYGVLRDNKFNKMFSSIELDGKTFEKGRYSYIGSYDSSETYFPLSYDFNICEGWNIEGTPHNHALWNHILAYPTDNLDYIAKNLVFWNVRTVLLEKRFNKVGDELNKKIPFDVKAERDGNKFYASNTPSSYFLTDKRNAIILGVGSIAVPIEFPYLVKGSSNRISDYPLKELEKYKLIYLCEPSVDTIQEQISIEKTVTHLVDKGVTVIIEPAATKSLSLFDVAASDVILENSPILQKQDQSPIISTIAKILIDRKFSYSRVLFGLDGEYYKLVQNDGRLQNSIIGTKRVGSGQVIFLGMHLSQFLKPVYARNWGVPQNNVFPECSADVTKLFEDIFRTYGVNTNFWPDSFPVQSSRWNYKGVDFDYTSQSAEEMTLSVTYTPRWKATIDGKPLSVGQKENLITLDLPEGDHQVSLRYGITKYGVIGYTISGIGFILLFLFMKFYDKILYRVVIVCEFFSKFLQL